MHDLIPAADDPEALVDPLDRNPPDTASFAADIASLTGFGNGKSSLPRAKSDRDLPLRHCTAEAQSICPHGGVPLP